MKLALQIVLTLSGLALWGLGAQVQSASELDRLVSQGWENYRNARYEEAVRDFNRVVRQDPENVSAAEGLGAAATRLQDWMNAKRGYELACGLSPGNCDFTKSLADVYLAMKLYDRALLQFEKVIGKAGSPGCDSGDAGAMTDLGYLYYRAGNEESNAKAVQVFKQVIASGDADSSILVRAHLYLGILCLKQNFDLAMRNFERCFELAPDGKKGREVLGRILVHNAGEALRLTDDPVEIAGLTWMKAKVMGATGRHQEAIDLLTTIVDSPTWSGSATAEIHHQEELLRGKGSRNDR